MPTAGDLVDETLGLLLSPALGADQVTTLDSTLAADELTFQVTDVRSGVLGISPGVIEIGSELVYCSAVDESGAGVITSWGRGYRGTTPAAHAAGSVVTSQPSYPRTTVLDKLNQAIERVYPRIFAVRVTTLTTHVPQVTYDLPEDAGFVLDARWQPPSGTGYWQGIKRWRNSRGGTSVQGDPGVSVDVADPMTPGCPIEFTYAAVPGAFADEGDDFAEATGLPTSMRDVIVIGAAAALTTGQELSRLQQTSIEQRDRARLVPASAALTSSRFLEQKFQLRMQEEIAALRTKYPVRIRGGWL